MPSIRAKKVITYAAVAFVLFYLFTRPANAAEAVNSVVDGVFVGADQLAVFFTKLTAT